MSTSSAVISAIGSAARALVKHGPELVQAAQAAHAAHAAHAAAAAPGAPAAAAADAAAQGDAPAPAPLRHPPGNAMAQRLQKQLKPGTGPARAAPQVDAQEALAAAQARFGQAVKNADELMQVLGQTG